MLRFCQSTNNYKKVIHSAVLIPYIQRDDLFQAVFRLEDCAMNPRDNIITSKLIETSISSFEVFRASSYEPAQPTRPSF